MCASHHKKIFSCTTGSGRDSGYIVEGIHVAVVLGCRGGAIHLTSIFLRERQRGKVETAMCVCVCATCRHLASDPVSRGNDHRVAN